MNALEVQELRKVYASRQGDVVAVDGVSFAVAPGEVLALLGPNGAGKSTTIRCVTTLLRPTAGVVRVVGHDVVQQPDLARAALGYVPQEVALDRHLTGLQHLELAARLHRVPAAERAARLEETLRLVDLLDRARDPIKTYSGGMKKRLDLACGLVHRPKLLVLDEPTVGLDIQTRLALWRFVADLRAKGTAVLLTTHLMDEADELADRVAIIDRGKLQRLGTSAELKAGFGGEMVKVDLGPATPDDAALAGLRGLPGVRGVERRGRALLVVAERAREAAPRVAEALEAARLAPRGLSFGAPSLDDVFLQVTGHAIRDDA